SRKLWDKSVRGKGNLGLKPICATEPNLPRKSGKSPFCAIAIRILLGNLAQMPDLIEGHGAAAAKTVVEHEIQVYPPNGTGRETGRELVRRELCLAGHIGHGLAAVVVILARMAGVRRVVP
ncbi:hypothetical protein, partial [Paracoccus sp. AS002]|uniref:hypothetical protein n=1 Tax=Paracoccus sp. AS002 TaxID=3019545 RepID=UPI0023E7B8B2